MMITLYQTEWCPYCHRVRQALTELGLTFTAVNVPYLSEERVELRAVAGQAAVPVLTDGDKVYGDSDEIIQYLRSTYPSPEDADEHAAHGAWRAATPVSLAPRAALARLREVLEQRGFLVLAQTQGPEINDRLPEEYAILQVTVPVAAVKAFAVDPLAPVAMMLPIAVVPTEDGKSVVAAADPLGQVWLYGEPDLIKVQAAVRRRLKELFAEL
jgi:glutathione S-transferase